MISVQNAYDFIISTPYSAMAESISVHDSQGRVLMQEILADTDLPPFDRVMMDGIAIREEDWEKGIRRFRVVGIQRAGEAQKYLQENGTCLEVMTGAVNPRGASVIIPYEQVTINNGFAETATVHVKPGQHIHKKGSDKKRNEVLVNKGRIIGAAEIAVAASTGLSRIDVASLPRIHIFSTGDELVGIEQAPLPHQIRRSNVYALQQLLRAHGVASTESHISDNETALESALKLKLDECDVILLSGGVSKGKFDLVPDVLEHLGVQKIFHRIAQKPGKPMWFGKNERTVVFAFPGNPVSTFLCATRYLLPWLKHSMQQPIPVLRCRLSIDAVNESDLCHFLQVKISMHTNGEMIADPIPGKGSGDFANLVEADGYAELPARSGIISANSLVDVYTYR